MRVTQGEFWFRLIGRLAGPFRRSESDAAPSRWASDEPRLRRNFVEAATASGKPRGLRWTEIEWTGSVRFGRDRESNLMTAFAGVVVRFEAADPEEADEFAAAGMPRDAVALFHYGRVGWGTGGRAMFNMTPDEALERLRSQYEPLGGPT